MLCAKTPRHSLVQRTILFYLLQLQKNSVHDAVCQDPKTQPSTTVLLFSSVPKVHCYFTLQLHIFPLCFSHQKTCHFIFNYYTAAMFCTVQLLHWRHSKNLEMINSFFRFRELMKCFILVVNFRLCGCYNNASNILSFMTKQCLVLAIV